MRIDVDIIIGAVFGAVAYWLTVILCTRKGLYAARYHYKGMRYIVPLIVGTLMVYQGTIRETVGKVSCGIVMILLTLVTEYVKAKKNHEKD